MSYFWAFFMTSQISGNIIAGFVLRSGSNQSTLFIVFAILSVVGSATFLCLSKPVKVDLDAEQDSQNQVQRLSSDHNNYAEEDM